MALRIVSVFGATGLQGSAVANALLKDDTLTPRAIAGNPESEAALTLKARGVEVIKGDSRDKRWWALCAAARLSSRCATAIIFPLKAEGEGPNELVQGKNMVDAAKEAGVRFFILTSLPSLIEFSGGKYNNCPHFEQKAAVQKYLESSGLANASLHLGAFLEKVLKKTTTGFNVAMPNYGATAARQALTSVERDVLAATLALLENYTDSSKHISGKSYPIVDANMTYAELAATGKVQWPA
ncbi:hypothetical protein B0H17DRAFT_1193484 [Mycena rosella]|uniref:NmrA-like domain-containing protein n=1 Tax=Mycena rosella TaxID=1033263 RepID=A0AAD7M7U9_MYCRO|nr:hypothetical protein B0H17DRAFT_1193484 [Mycena rosella]